jgi:hypothetical protein
MSEVWEHSDEVLCTHPGWVTLHGWSEVAGSFYALFSGEQRVQFVLTDEHVVVRGNTAWVAIDENILGDQGGATVSALNVFVHSSFGRWRMVAHQASLVSPPTETDEVD